MSTYDEGLAMVVGFGDAQEMDVGFDQGETFEVDMGYVPVQARYSGPYTFTPTTDAQTISIEGRTASHDIIVEAIPSNYGLISWSGSGIRVS